LISPVTSFSAARLSVKFPFHTRDPKSRVFSFSPLNRHAYHTQGLSACFSKSFPPSFGRPPLKLISNQHVYISSVPLFILLRPIWAHLHITLGLLDSLTFLTRVCKTPSTPCRTLIFYRFYASVCGRPSPPIATLGFTNFERDYSLMKRLSPSLTPSAPSPMYLVSVPVFFPPLGLPKKAVRRASAVELSKVPPPPSPPPTLIVGFVASHLAFFFSFPQKNHPGLAYSLSRFALPCIFSCASPMD